MCTNGQKQRSKINALTGILCCFLLTAMPETATYGQQWPVGHQPTRFAVPQYRGTNPVHPTAPRSSLSYPLNDSDHQGAAAEPSEVSPPNASQLPAPLPNHPTPIPQGEPSPATLAQPRPLEILNQAQTLTPGAPLSTKHPPVTYPLPLPADPERDSMRSPTNTTKRGADYSIYRDLSSHPIDPRKPCIECIQPKNQRCFKHLDWPGKDGQPYQERERGGCECSAASCKSKPNFSLNWPAPFSAALETHLSQVSGHTPRKRINDRFDHLANFKLINYHRTDNGYCGVGADPYGCLGESRYGK
jgi:hypothetical protein